MTVENNTIKIERVCFGCVEMIEIKRVIAQRKRGVNPAKTLVLCAVNIE